MTKDTYTAYRVAHGHWVDELHNGTLDDCKAAAAAFETTATENEFAIILKE